jgi:hypothetical protein
MAKIPYSYSGEEPFIRNNKNKSIRFLFLIIFVTIITGAIIWFILPKEKRTNIIKRSSQIGSTQSKTNSPLSNTQNTTNNVSSSSTNLDKDKTTTAPDASSNNNITTSKKSLTTAENKKELVSNNTNNNDDVDNKGIVTPQDLPKEADKPELLPFTVTKELQEKLASATTYQNNHNYKEANYLAKELLDVAPVSSNFGREAAAILSESNWLRFAIGGPIPKCSITHVVKSGDSLSKLALKYKTTIDAIRLSNALKSDIVKLGQKLTIYPGPWEIIISKKSRQLILRHGITKEFFLIFDVGIGRMGSTPKATFKVSGRIRHPQWRTSDGRIYPYGSPENQLGKYFIKLAPTGDSSPKLTGYGIHGTPDESSVQRSLSRGCVRMRNAEIERLFTVVPYNTAVQITD